VHKQAISSGVQKVISSGMRQV